MSIVSGLLPYFNLNSMVWQHVYLLSMQLEEPNFMSKD